MISAISFLVVFSIVVLVHEFGHFTAARRAGVKVYEFSIGFPFSPKIFKLFRHKETEFTVRLLPLGGFVSFSKDGNEDAKELFDASYLNRTMIMAAGSVFNIIFAFLLFVFVFAIGKHLSLFEAVMHSANMLWTILAGTFDILVNIFSGNGSMDGLSGPVGIAAMAGQAAGKGFMSLVYFTGILSMSLGIMNLIPFPALDGGQLTILLLERLSRRPLSMKVHQAINLTGLSLFLILTVLVTLKTLSG